MELSTRKQLEGMGYSIYQKEDGSYFCTDPEYWDCECRDKYIHHKSRLKKCGRCNTSHDEQPDSRVNEIKYLYDINEGWC